MIGILNQKDTYKQYLQRLYPCVLEEIYVLISGYH